MLDIFKIRFLNMKNKLKKEFDFIYNFYKKSVIDIRQFFIYIIKKAFKFHLILLILVAFYVIINIYFPSVAPNFNGVLISILAAVVFEGYRSYRKYVKNKILEEVDFKILKQAFLTLAIYIINNEAIMEVRLTNNDNQNIVRQIGTCTEMLKTIKEDLIEYNKLNIEPKFVNGVYDKIGNKEYDCGIRFYDEIKLHYKKDVYDIVLHISDVLPIYSNNTSIVNDLKMLRNYIVKFISNDFLPGIYRNGTVYARYEDIIFLLDKTINFVNKIDSDDQ